jgi:hypothetical protein
MTEPRAAAKGCDTGGTLTVGCLLKDPAGGHDPHAHQVPYTGGGGGHAATVARLAIAPMAAPPRTALGSDQMLAIISLLLASAARGAAFKPTPKPSSDR